jgi:hypothetical protein
MRGYVTCNLISESSLTKTELWKRRHEAALENAQKRFPLCPQLRRRLSSLHTFAGKQFLARRIAGNPLKGAYPFNLVVNQVLTPVEIAGHT